jgi:hypothetical protein
MPSPRGIYVSGDELERAEASDLGCRDVGRHPNEIDRPATDETLVMDFDHGLFEDQGEAVAKANGVSSLAGTEPIIRGSFCLLFSAWSIEMVRPCTWARGS